MSMGDRMKRTPGLDDGEWALVRKFGREPGGDARHALALGEVSMFLVQIGLDQPLVARIVEAVRSTDMGAEQAVRFQQGLSLARGALGAALSPVRSDELTPAQPDAPDPVPSSDERPQPTPMIFAGRTQALADSVPVLDVEVERETISDSAIRFLSRYVPGEYDWAGDFTPEDYAALGRGLASYWTKQVRSNSIDLGLFIECRLKSRNVHEAAELMAQQVHGEISGASVAQRLTALVSMVHAHDGDSVYVRLKDYAAGIAKPAPAAVTSSRPSRPKPSTTVRHFAADPFADRGELTVGRQDNDVTPEDLGEDPDPHETTRTLIEVLQVPSYTPEQVRAIIDGLMGTLRPVNHFENPGMKAARVRIVECILDAYAGVSGRDFDGFRELEQHLAREEVGILRRTLGVSIVNGVTIRIGEPEPAWKIISGGFSRRNEEIMGVRARRAFAGLARYLQSDAEDERTSVVA